MLNFILLICVVASLAGLAVAFIPPVESGIPPTPAFSTITIDGVVITADSYNDRLTITTSGSLSTTVNGNTVTIKIDPLSCPLLQGVTGIDANGNLICGVI